MRSNFWEEFNNECCFNLYIAEECCSLCMSAKELFPIALIISILGKDWSLKRMVVQCDNEGPALAWDKTCSIPRIILNCIVFNFLLKAIHMLYPVFFRENFSSFFPQLWKLLPSFQKHWETNLFEHLLYFIRSLSKHPYYKQEKIAYLNFLGFYDMSSKAESLDHTMLTSFIPYILFH